MVEEPSDRRVYHVHGLSRAVVCSFEPGGRVQKAESYLESRDKIASSMGRMQLLKGNVALDPTEGIGERLLRRLYRCLRSTPIPDG